MAGRAFHVVRLVGAGQVFQPDRLLEMPQTHVLKQGDVLESDVEVGQADAADLGGGTLVGHVLDIGEVHLGHEVDCAADCSVSPQPCPANIIAVFKRERQGPRVLVPGVVELDPAADVEPECLVRAFQHGAMVPEGVEPRPRIRAGRLGGGIRLLDHPRWERPRLIFIRRGHRRLTQRGPVAWLLRQSRRLRSATAAWATTSTTSCRTVRSLPRTVLTASLAEMKRGDETQRRPGPVTPQRQYPRREAPTHIIVIGGKASPV